LEGPVELAAGFARRFVLGLHGSWFAQFTVRPFEATSNPVMTPKPT
jgi:hypothetical protein